MAVPPTVPTSFVPKQSIPDGRRKEGGTNIFLIVSLIVLGLALLGAGGVFAYDKYLERALKARASELEKVQANIDDQEIESYVRLDRRFTMARVLLNTHVAPSQFFTAVENFTLENVRLEGLSLLIAEDRAGELTITGKARNFNALAAQSNEIAKEKRIKRAIFSGLTIDEKTEAVSFKLDADIEPALVVLARPAATATETPPVEEPAAPTEAPAAPVATTTPPVSAATTTTATTTRP